VEKSDVQLALAFLASTEMTGGVVSSIEKIAVVFDDNPQGSVAVKTTT